ncbi:MAG: hypothetical protein COA94_02450 [Rickettsiales bacterium]|nr:MAG: hypothetical protein COA94_02450 [Rickettsiales bacterium]
MYIARGRYIQRGRGWGGVFKSIFRTIMPLVSKIGKSIAASPTAMRVANTAKQSIANSALSVAADAISGENVGESLERNWKRTRQDLGNSLAPPPRAKKAKKKKKKTKFTARASKYRRDRDIFD